MDINCNVSNKMAIMFRLRLKNYIFSSTIFRRRFYSSADSVVLGCDGGVWHQREIPLPQVRLGKNQTPQIHRRFQRKRFCCSGQYSTQFFFNFFYVDEAEHLKMVFFIKLLLQTKTKCLKIITLLYTLEIPNLS